jgi:Domain of unknown function (DUF1707)
MTGPEEGAPAGRDRLRASHADREQVIDAVKTAFADGRLDKDELDARVGQALAARTYADLATVTADIPAVPAKTPPPLRPARPPVNKNTVKWGLIAAGAMIPPAMFVTAAYGVWWLVFPAFPLLFIELIVTIIIIPITLARQRRDRSRMSRGQLPPRPGQAGRAQAGRAQAGRAQAGRAVEAGRHGSTGPDPAPPVPAPARRALICGSTGPGWTGYAVARYSGASVTPGRA